MGDNTKGQLTLKQEAALLKYLECDNKTEAYKYAYDTANMNPATINRNAFKLFTENNKVVARIEQELQKRRFEAEITQERILEEEKCLAYFDPAKLFEMKTGTLIHPKDLPEVVRRAIVGLEIKELKRTPEDEPPRYWFKYKFSDKGKSLERIGRHLSMYNDKLTIGIDPALLQAIKDVFGGEWYALVMKRIVEIKGQTPKKIT